MDQMSRTATLDKFRAGEIQLLAASDVAARGLDIPDVSHVFNFDVPWQADDYVHRIGRTGRAGREGLSATLVTMDDVKALKEIEKITGEAAVWLGEAPSAEELAEGATRKRRRGAASGGRDDRRGSGRDRQRESSGRGKGTREGADTAEMRAQRPHQGARRGVDVHVEPTQVFASVAGDSATPVHESAGDNRERSRNRRRGGSRPQRAAPPAVGGAAGQGEQPMIAAEPERASDAPRQSRPRDAGRDASQDRSREGRAAPRERSHEGMPAGERRPDRHAEGRRPPRQDRPREERPREPRPVHADAERRERRPQRRDDLGPRVGFEDNIPAFLRRPARQPG
jgi:superfamily II DNA/RNA helicase